MDDGQPGPGASRPRVDLVASTGDITASTTSGESGAPSSAPPPGNAAGDVRGYFETAQWTADGTTIVTYSSAHEVSAYVVPEDLLAPRRPAPLTLSPQATVQLPEPSNALAPAPYFSLAEPYTNQVLVSARDHPIQLFYLTPSSTSAPTSTSPSLSPVAAYPFTKARSETFLNATSLLWPYALGAGGGTAGSHFVAGSRNLLAKFDVSRPGASSEPVLRIKTIPSERHLSKGGGVGMRGVVSALGAQPSGVGSGAAAGTGLVAAGTWTRWVGLYDFGAAGECVATWNVAAAASSEVQGDGEGDALGNGHAAARDGIGGSGITQTIWSPCGRYLVIGERRSRGLLVYDVRVTGRLLGCLVGRDGTADVNQRVLCDVFPGGGEGSESGFEVWSGTAAHDGGAVQVWEGVGSRVGAHPPSWGWRAHDDGASTVGSTCLHPSGSVVATCAGSWAFPNDGEDEDGDGMAWMRRSNRESSLKLWSLVSDDENDDNGCDGPQEHASGEEP